MLKKFERAAACGVWSWYSPLRIQLERAGSHIAGVFRKPLRCGMR